MSQLIDNLNLIVSIKSDIKSAIENKGVDMTGVSFGSYASKIGEISGGGTFVTETLNVSVNGTYTPGEGVDGYSQVVVDVPISGWDQKSITEGTNIIINLDNSASFVASSAFNGNKTIQTVNLPYATSVGGYAFNSCYVLNQLSLPMCSYIGNYAFYTCSSLSQVNLPVCISIGQGAFLFCKSLSQVSLPVCSYIGNSVFEQCKSLSQVSLPVCSYIGNYAFYTCSSLSRITIGYSSVCSLANYNAFEYTQITSSTGSIYVPTSLVDAYKSAKNWSYFSTQIFPIIEPSLSFDSTTGLLSGNCSALLSSVEINSFLSDNNIDRASITQISLPYLTYFAGFETFAGCSNLISVSLPVCDDIGPQTFESCTSLSDIYIPNCKTVGAAAFRNCEMLQNISLPVCDYIGLSAFSNTKLYSIVLGSTSVCSLNNINALGNTPIASGTGSIYVPASLVNAYKSAKNWSQYSNRIFPIE